jgi:hypothetical protein
MGKKSGSGMNDPDHNSESCVKQFFEVKMLKFFDADPGWKKFGCCSSDRWRSVKGLDFDTLNRATV